MYCVHCWKFIPSFRTSKAKLRPMCLIDLYSEEWKGGTDKKLLPSFLIFISILESVNLHFK